MAFITYPLNDIDYTAEDAELFHCTRTSGIHANTAFKCSCTGTNNTVTIGPGIAWIHNTDFAGKVAAMKASQAVSLSVPDSTYPRIDTIAIQFSADSNETSLIVKQGTPASSPVAQSISQTASRYELHLYHIRREPGATAITAADITDLRLDSKYCGLMADSVTKIDTSAINAQVKSLLDRLEKEIASRLESVDNSLNSNSQGVPIPTVNQAGFFLCVTADGTAYELVDLINLYIWEKYESNPNISETNVEDVTLSDYSSLGGSNTWDKVSYSDNYEVQDGEIVLVNPTTITLNSSTKDQIIGKYIYSNKTGCFYWVPSDAETSYSSGTYSNAVSVSKAVQLTKGGAKIGLVSSSGAGTYPENGEHTDGYWYVYHKQMGD